MYEVLGILPSHEQFYFHQYDLFYPVLDKTEKKAKTTQSDGQSIGQDAGK